MSQMPFNLEVGEFVASMPASYAQAFDRAAMVEHAQIVGARASQRPHAAVWRKLPNGLAVLCVVADDRPGVLSIVSAVLVLHRLTVTSAHVFRRIRPDGTKEAVDFFWVRNRDRAPGPRRPPGDEHLERCLRTLIGFLDAHPDPTELPSETAMQRMAEVELRVYFDSEGERFEDAVLVVEAPDGPGLLLTIARSLYELGVDIISSSIDTDGVVARDRFVLATAEDPPLPLERRREIESKLIAALRKWQEPQREFRAAL